MSMERCNGCAFRPGTEAHASPLTLTKARLCALAADPFYCHENATDDGTLPKGEERLCIGWSDVITTMYRRGDFERQTEPQRQMIRAALAAIIKLEDKIIAGEDVDDFDMPTEMMAMLDSETFL